MFVFDANDACICHSWRCEKTILDLQWMNIFAATNYNILETTCDNDMSRRKKLSLVTRLRAKSAVAQIVLAQ